MAFRGCKIHHSANQSATTLAFDSEDYDVGGWHSTSVDNHLVTVLPGVEMVLASGQGGIASGTQVILEIWKNGAPLSPVVKRESNTMVASALCGQIVSYPILVTGGDTLQLRHLEGATMQAAHTWFAVEELILPRAAYNGALVGTSGATGDFTTPAAIAYNLDSGGDLNDVGGWHDTAVNNSRLTRIAGVDYARFIAQCHITGHAINQWASLELRKNGAAMNPSIKCLWTPFYTTRDQIGQVFSPALALAGSDYLEHFLGMKDDTSVSYNTVTTWFGVEAL